MAMPVGPSWHQPYAVDAVSSAIFKNVENQVFEASFFGLHLDYTMFSNGPEYEAR
jgi:hypothetical protein